MLTKKILSTKKIFIFLLAFFLISYIAKLGNFFSFSGVVTPFIFFALFFLSFFLKKEKIEINLYDILLIVALVYSFVSVFFNEILIDHFMLLMQFNFFAVGSYFLLRFISFDSNEMMLLFKYISFIFLCSIFLALILFPTGSLFNISLRLGGEYFNSVGLAYVTLLVFSSSLISLCYLQKSFSLFSVLFTFSLIFSLIILFLTGSRGPFGVAMIIILMISIKTYINLSILKKSSILIILISLFVFAIFNLELNFQARVLDFSINDSISNRFVTFKKAYNAISESPFLGDGFSNFQSINGYPHNIFLELILYYGIIGFLFSFVIAISLVYLPLNIVFNTNNPKVAFFIILFAMLAPKLVSTNIAMSKEFLIFLSIYLTNKNIINSLYLSD